MARLASQAVAGFYATPENQVPRIASLLRVDVPDDDEAEAVENLRVSVLDPCAGEGVAIEQMTRLLTAGIQAAKDREQARKAAEWREKERLRKAELEETASVVADPEPLPSQEDPEKESEEPEDEEADDDEESEDAPSNPNREITCADVYTVELERGRHKVLKDRRIGYQNHQKALHGDAFCAAFETGGKSSGVGLLFLNPPYDQDKTCGRLEEKFLRRFTDAIAPGGVLVFVVPYYALAASAETLATRYEDVACYRFAGADFDAYKQVVLFARRLDADRFELDAETRDLVVLWADRGRELPELPEAGKPHRRQRYTVPTHDHYATALAVWKMRVVDAKALLAKYVPWCESPRRGSGALLPVTRVVSDFALVDAMHRTYEIATPPRPAHIAAGLAAGLFNGQRIEPDDPTSKLPPLLIKGCFDREWRTVEEKHDKQGNVSSVVQVQQPKLVITVLDLQVHKYHTLGSTLEASGAKSIAEMSITDILQHYGRSLMGVMERQCVIRYDPRRDAGDVTVAESPRKLFGAQEHAVKAMVKFLREKPGEHVLAAAEIGSGKSTISLMTAKTMKARRILVLCPPHLLDSWRNEVKAVLPEAEYRVLDSISAIDEINDPKKLSKDKLLVAVLSREAAKLGHRLESVAGRCPSCAAPLIPGHDYAKKHERCGAREILPEDKYAHFARAIAMHLRLYANNNVDQYLPAQLHQKHFRRRQALCGVEVASGEVESPVYGGLPAELTGALREVLVESARHAGGDSPARKALVWLLAATGAPPDVVLDTALRLKPEYSDYQHYAESLLLLLPPGGALGAAYELLATFSKPSYSYGGAQSSTEWFKQQYAKLAKALPDDDPESAFESSAAPCAGVGSHYLTRGPDGLMVDNVELGSPEAAAQLLKQIGAMGKWRRGPECEEHLYQSTPEPRRYPLAKYIVRRHKRTFDFVIADEIQEYANDSSAQTIAAHRLVALRRPMVFMTGTVMNGYAKSLFPTMTAISSDFRSEFDRDDLSAFVDRYGYRKRILSDREDGEIVAFGTQSDRVERSERDAGDAPGVLPLFLFRHLLASTVTLHKADLRLDLPTLTQDRDVIVAAPDVQAEYGRLLEALKKQIKADMFQPGLAGKLFGQLSEFPSYLDCCTEDVGNVDGGGAFEIRYPEGAPEVGGQLVASGTVYPARAILAKEAKMLAFVEAEVAAGRNVMVLGWHLRLLPRLARLLAEKIGDVVPVLYADKVSTGKRQAWIEREVVGKRRRVMVCNPVCVQTGLNSLVHFSSQWWHESPACNPLTFRQAVGRIDRIGQRLPTKTVFGYYGETLQEKIYDLLMAKVAISTAVDGLSPEAAWAAAGIVEDEHLLGLSLGKALWDMMNREDDGGRVVPINRARKFR